MAETTATTRPSRARRTTSTAAKPAATKATPAKAEADVTRFKVELDNAGDTKSYTKFVVPENLKGTVVGSIYAPLGTKRVVIMVVGPDDNGDD